MRYMIKVGYPSDKKAVLLSALLVGMLLVLGGVHNVPTA